jgi:hypothetical protein
MKEQKELEVFGGEIIRKSFFEYFEPSQWLYGSPYHYIVEYDDKSGGTSDKRYCLWKFNMDSLKYELYQTVGEKASNILDNIADKWEKDEWTARKQKQEADE